MSAQPLLPTTAGIHPEKFVTGLDLFRDRYFTVAVLVLFLVVGFTLRVSQLGAESFSEDELNKLQTIEVYRANGLSGKNGEHPFLMKGLQWASVVAAERINSFSDTPAMKISDEAAIRFPLALFGTFTILLLFFLISELFGRSIGLVSAMLWAVEPMAVGFDRMGKEDGLVLFFFLLTNLLWIRSQTAAERGKRNWMRYALGAAAAFGALMASKYYPHMLGVVFGYYIIFQQISGQKWAVGTARWPKFFLIMAASFILLNPTILLPDTWREMLTFSSESRVAHDSYEFLGHFYRNQASYWLAGVPWTFYYVFIAVKTSLSTLVLFLVGLPLIFRRRLGDGRFLIFFWAFFWFFPFTILGGKFTRYFTLAEPLIVIVAAVGVFYVVKWVTDRLPGHAKLFQTVALASVISFPLYNSIMAGPHYRLFTNVIGASFAPVGSYFPHDEFYDASSREIVDEAARLARSNAIIACETPELYKYYAGKIGREDLIFVTLSDKAMASALKVGDLVAAAKGRRYASNLAYLEYLEQNVTPVAETRIGNINSSKIYRLDSVSAQAINSIAGQ